MLIEILSKLRVLPIIEELLVHYSGFSLLSLLLSRSYSIPYIPTLLLTTIGKKSGLRRTVPLFFFRDGDSYFVIGSRGGAPKDPSWIPNLKIKPRALIRVDRKTLHTFAEFIEGHERERLWNIAVKAYPPYEKYEESAAPREIPIIRLNPATPA
jgi:deazaflavin-dependent oxidoreductase (nitroreductase family)